MWTKPLVGAEVVLEHRTLPPEAQVHLTQGSISLPGTDGVVEVAVTGVTTALATAA